MANDSQREKARAVFGKTFFENSKAQPLGKQTNSMQALQQRANARPIPTYKVGGVVKKNPEVLAQRGAQRAIKAEQDFSKPLREAVMRAAAKGTPVMKQGGPTDEYTAKRVRARMEAGNYKDGGEVDRYKGKLDRKKADIESDYKKALAKGKNADVAKAKYEQRMADAADDYAKWTKGDRTATKAAEKAAEKNLTMTRKSARNSPTGSGAKTSEALVKKAEESMTQPLSSTGPTPVQKISISKPKAKAPVRKAAAPVRRAAAQGRPVAAPKSEAPAPKVPATAPKVAAAAPKVVTTSPKVDQRIAAAERLERQAAEKRRLEQAPTGSSGAALARLKNLVGFGSGADTRSAANYRAQVAREQREQSAVATKAQRDRAAAAAAAQAKAKANADRVAKLRAAGREADAKFYERNPNALKTGGKVGKYAAGGAGKVRKGQMKGK